MAAGSVDSLDAIIDCFVGTEMPPLFIKPARDCCDELTTISEILDSHPLLMFVGDTWRPAWSDLFTLNRTDPQVFRCKIVMRPRRESIARG